MKSFKQFLSESRYPTTPDEDEISRHAESTLKDMHGIMRSKGFKHGSHRQSALVHHVYKREDGHHVEVSGWHGSGSGNRDYGGSKTIHQLYHRTPDKKEHTIDGPELLNKKGKPNVDVKGSKAAHEKMIAHLRSIK